HARDEPMLPMRPEHTASSSSSFADSSSCGQQLQPVEFCIQRATAASCNDRLLFSVQEVARPAEPLGEQPSSCMVGGCPPSPSSDFTEHRPGRVTASRRANSCEQYLHQRATSSRRWRPANSGARAASEQPASGDDAPHVSSRARRAAERGEHSTTASSGQRHLLCATSMLRLACCNRLHAAFCRSSQLKTFMLPRIPCGCWQHNNMQRAA
ncbi:hypothetical protein Dimus_018023, partial [Dionaea muscipula]